ncbi:copper amine oxidase N-terminal domain-containing protein [Paenibacillus sp. 22594]|uniref:copper amine oxidase N-terminal domain-containing protein n=1 Tax=Paenibacillus sp. 22594 TaxID=3453947 RepID=UPI003F86F87A
MSKVKIPAAALLLLLSIGAAPLTASAPLSASAASVAVTAASTTNTIKVQNMNVRMIFDGVSMVPPPGQLVFIHNNTTYVPVRFMSYALQKSVTWDAKNLKVTVGEPNGSELVVMKDYIMNVANTNATFYTSKPVTLTSVKANFVFDGVDKSLPANQSSYILNGALYVPLRFLSESVGNVISWDQKAKVISAASKSYQEQVSEGNTAGNAGQGASTITPTQAGGSTSGKLSYEDITSATEAKLNALKNQSQSTLMSIAFEYLAAKDDASKTSIKNKGLEQLSSFTASFNSIVADAEQQLKANGYSTDVISQYRSAFEAELQAGKSIAESMGN